MNDKIKSALKLIVSLGLGFVLIFYFYNQISAPKEAVVDRSKFTQFSKIEKIVVSNNTYCKVGDTLFYYNNGQAFLAETEAFYSLTTTTQLDKKNNYIIGTYRIDIITIMKKVFSNASWFWLVLSLLASFSSHLIRSLRWRMMLQPLGYQPKAYNTFFAVMIMYMANMAFPRLGEVLRCTMITRYEKIPIEKSLGTMLTERLMDMICLLLLGAIMVFTQYGIIENYFKENYLNTSSESSMFSAQKIIVIVSILLFVIALGFVIYKKIQTGTSKIATKIKSIAKGLVDGVVSVKNIQNKPLFIIYSISIWVCYTLTIYFCLQAVPDTSMQGIGASITCLFFGSLAIVAVQGGLGIYPIVVSKILMLYGTQESIGYAYGWLSWVVQTVLVLVIGFISMILMANMNKEPDSSTSK